MAVNTPKFTINTMDTKPTSGALDRYLSLLSEAVQPRQGRPKHERKSKSKKFHPAKDFHKNRAKPTKSFHKDKEFHKPKKFHETPTLGTASNNVSDWYSEGTYADSQDLSVPAVQPEKAAVVAKPEVKDRQAIIKDVVDKLQELANTYDWVNPVNIDTLKNIADQLRSIDIEPTDIEASIGAPAHKQRRFLVTGPSSWEGGLGALKDLQALLKHASRHPFYEDESNPGSDLAGGSSDSVGMADLSEHVYRIGNIILDNPFGTGPKHFHGTDRIEAASEADALNKYIRLIAEMKGIRQDPRIMYSSAKKNGAKVTRLPDSPPPPPPEYWWNKD
jgi:hypothetical protein